MNKIKEVKVTKRFCTGDYEYDEISVTLEVSEEANEGDITDVIQAIKEEIVEGQKEKSKEESKNGKSNSSKNSNKSKKNSIRKDEPTSGESTEDDEGPDSEASDTDNDSSEETESREETSDTETEEEQDEGEESSSSKGKTSSKVEGKKSFKRKPQTYDRSIDQHKEIFSGLLRSIAPDWKKTEDSKKKAKKVSEQLEDEPFLDEAGEVLESFKARVKKLMK